MNRTTLILSTAAFLFANDGRGIRPRASSADYPVQEKTRGGTIAAAVVSPDHVQKLFATDLNRAGYFVIEVAIYPEAGREIAVSSDDFMLRIGGDPTTVRPASPLTIAGVLHHKNTPPAPRASDVTLYPTAEIGYESGGYDPLTGRRRSSGVYTGAGVGVGVGGAGGPVDPRPASTDRDRNTMQQELEDKALPEGMTTRAVAGYLYFPKPAGKVKNALFNITYYGADGQVHLAIPPPRK